MKMNIFSNLYVDKVHYSQVRVINVNVYTVFFHVSITQTKTQNTPKIQKLLKLPFVTEKPSPKVSTLPTPSLHASSGARPCPLSNLFLPLFYLVNLVLYAHIMAVCPHNGCEFHSHCEYHKTFVYC